MMGKIMSEAAHSIIGMLSAKPLDMETRTANNEFSSLLLPGGNRAGLTLDNDGADKTDDKTSEQFLEQLIGNDDRPVPATSTRAATNITERDTGAPMGDEDIAPSSEPVAPSVSVSEMERFISVLPQSPTKMVADTPKTSVIRQDNIAVSKGLMNEQKQPDMKLRRSTQLPVSEPVTDKPKRQLGDVSKIPTGPLIFVDEPSGVVSTATPVSSQFTLEDEGKVQTAGKQSVDSKSPAAFKPLIEARSVLENKPIVEGGSLTDSKPVSPPAVDTSKVGTVENTTAETVQKTPVASTYIPAKPYTDAQMVARFAANQVNGKALATGATPADASADRTVMDSLGLRLASGRKAESPVLRPASELEVRAPAAIVDKPMKIETIMTVADMETVPAAAPLDSNIELSGPVPAAMVSEVQNVAQKPVNFDWNAPQFAERFASEISDLKINGDLKKFEINPRNMGRLEVSFVTRGGVEILQIEAENDAAREMIVQHSQAIQDMLKSQGRSDLTLRVDVRENMFGAPQNDSMDFSQQDSADAQQNRPAPQHNGDIAMPIETDPDPTGPSDNNRYA